MAKEQNKPKTGTGKPAEPFQSGFADNPPVPDMVRNYDFMGEYGRIGQQRYAGIFYEEYEQRLRGRRGVEIYTEMSESDSIVGAILFAVEMLLRQAKWYIEPAGSNEADKKAALFLTQCMDDMQNSWQDTISEIMSFLVYGWSYHEICYKRRLGKNADPNKCSKYQDGLIGWKKFPIRAQDTLWQWIYDDSDNLIAMTQMAPPDFQIRTIPIEKALHFITKSRKQNPEGRSLLRNCYRDFYFKRRIQEHEGIGVERDLAGLPMLTPPEGVDIWDRNDPEMVNSLAYANKLVQNVRRDALEGIVIPNGWTFNLLSSGGKRQMDVGAIIERYDSRIAMTVLADFVLLGHQNAGSWALSSDKTELFSMAIGTYMDIICGVFNSQGIPRLMELNKEHFKGMTDYPKMAHGDIEREDIGKFSSGIATLVGAGVLEPSPELVKEVCRRTGLPEAVAAETTPSPEALAESASPQEGKASKTAKQEVEQFQKAWEQCGDDSTET